MKLFACGSEAAASPQHRSPKGCSRQSSTPSPSPPGPASKGSTLTSEASVVTLDASVSDSFGSSDSNASSGASTSSTCAVSWSPSESDSASASCSAETSAEPAGSSWLHAQSTSAVVTPTATPRATCIAVLVLPTLPSLGAAQGDVVRRVLPISLSKRLFLNATVGNGSVQRHPARHQLTLLNSSVPDHSLRGPGADATFCRPVSVS